MANSGIAKRRAAAKAEASDHYVARRRDLIRVAATVLQAQGLAGTSIDDIARAAGVDRATLYYYVGSKKELFEEVVYDALRANIEMAEAIQASTETPQDKLTQLIEKLVASYAENYPQMYVFVAEDLSQLTSTGRDERDIGTLQRRFDRALIAIIQEGMEAGVFRSDLSARLAAFGIIGMVNWTHRWFHPDGPVSGAEVGRAFATLGLQGLLAR